MTAFTNSSPIYRQLADMLRQQIESGHIAPNDAIPAERDLAASYEVSRDTVRKAIKLLEEQGVLYSDHGRGTFAAPAAVRKMSRFLDSFTEDTIKRGGVPGQKILVMEQVIPSMAIASLLNIDSETPILHLKRLRLMDGAPIGIQDSHVRLPPGEQLTRKELERTGSLYRLLVEKFGIEPSESLESIGAIPAASEEVELLNIPAGTPILVCERIMLSSRREPVEYCEMKYLPSYRYKTRISKWSIGQPA
ncbi:GntR family transcriptional regulator [Duganella sp. SG902]|uniref:GntR family transcriptional regulator n=1 Tax=Duganella sp. SG902 TaxID=2587016 RepID=UPI00159E6048|nr:GntR family transcriptional regulator [Duganella sp. SG902]NVM74282.1 GntR family transcriptional regulator [Duganella sp. SG902]